MQTIVRLTLLLSLLLIQISGEESSEECFSMSVEAPVPAEPDIDSSNTESFPSSIVGNVNVINGNYCDSEVDMMIQAPEPLMVQRDFGGCYMDYLQGWKFGHHNRHEVIKRTVPFEVRPRHCEFDNQQASGGIAELDSSISPKCNPNAPRFYLDMPVYDHEIFEYGNMQIALKDPKPIDKFFDKYWTNCSSIISGKTNIKNLVRLNHPEHHVFRDGAGTIYIFQFSKLSYVKKKNGNFLKFNNEEDPKDTSTKYITRLESYNRHDQLRAAYVVHGEQELAKKLKKKDSDLQLAITSSLGDSVQYFFEAKNKKTLVLKQVNRSQAPTIVYETFDKGFKKSYPDGRYLEVIGDKAKVTEIKAPLGTGLEPIAMYRFVYGKDVTSVYDAYGCITNYHYNKEKRLTTIVRHDPNQVYPIEKFHWGEPKTPLAGHLLSRSIVDSSGKAHIGRLYYYDLAGNITREELFGNLTGKNPTPLQCNAEGIPVYNGCEVYAKEYAYSNDKLNNKIKEGDGRSLIDYSYYPNSDQLFSKFTYSFRGLEERRFYGYDEDGCPTLEVVDDGKTPHFMDFTGASQCIIKKIRNRSVAPFGLPEEVAEYYVDFSTGKQVLLKKTISSYSLQGKLLRTNHYDGNDQFVYFTDYTYDEKGNLIQEINPLGHAIQRRYDANQNLIYEQGPSHEFYKTFTYDFSNRLIREDIIRADGGCFSVSYRYDLLGRKVGMTDIYGNETHYQYDQLGRLIQTVYPAVKLSDNQIKHPFERYAYDALGNVNLFVDPSGNVTRKEYTIRGKPFHIVYADGSEEFSEYTLDGLLAKTIAKNKSYTIFTYDYQGRLIHQANHDSNGTLISQTSAVYNAFHILKEVDAGGVETHYQYDFAGRVKKIIKGDSVTEFAYDSLSRIAKKIHWINDNEASVKKFTYDVLNRVLEETIEDLSGKIFELVRYSYDEQGNRTVVGKIVDGKYTQTIIQYDCFKQPKTIIDAEGNTVILFQNYAYYNDLQQRVPCLITVDPLGRQTIVVKNALGKVTSIRKVNAQNQEIQKVEQSYDLSGNLTSVVNTVFYGSNLPRKSTNLFVYDSLNRQTDVFEAWGEPEQKHTRTLYNIFGFKEAIVKPNGAVLYHLYDSQGRLTDFCSSDKSFYYHYTYDASNNLVKVEDRCQHWVSLKTYDRNKRLVKEVLGNQLEMNYAFDSLGRITFAKLANGKEIRFRYNAAHLTEVACDDRQHLYQEYDLSGHLLSAQLMEGSKINYKYTPLERTELIETPLWQEKVLAFNQLGQITKLKYAGSGSDEIQEYQYDELDQLCVEQGSLTNRYGYDSLGNRIEKNGQALAVNGLNQILSDGDQTYRYDTNGNLIQQGDYRYSYDALDRLIALETSSSKYVYTYDETNRRLRKICLKKVENQWQEVDVIHYMYQAQNEVGAYSKSKNEWEWRILGKGKGSELGATVYMELEGQGYIPLHDHVGNIRCLVNTRGELVEKYNYSAFGEEETSSWKNPWRFSSKRHDPETSFVFFGMRYYFAKLGKWITADPAGFADGPNLYTYVQNNPVSYYDLYGLATRGIFSFGSNGFNFSITSDKFGSHPAINNLATRAMNAIVNTIGDALFIFSTHLVPLGPWRMVMRKASTLVSSDPGRNLQEDLSRNHWNKMGKGNLVIITVNGILTSFDETFIRSSLLGHFFNAPMAGNAYNSTDGFVNDLGEVFLHRMGFRSGSLDAFVKSVKEAYAMNPDATIVVIAHSQAGQIVASSAEYLPPEIKARMHVYTFGSANLIPDEMYGKVRNYVSKSDPIPFLASPITYLRTRFGWDKSRSVEFLDSDVMFGLDHSFDNNVYQNEVIKIAQSYRR